MYFVFRISGILWWVVSTLHVPKSEMELVSLSSSLQLFDNVTTGGDHSLIRKWISMFHHFSILVAKCFDTPTPGIWNQHQKVFFAFQHFGIPAFLVMKCFDSPSLGIWNLHKKVFWRFTFRDFGTSVMKSLDSWLLQLSVSETPKWSLCWCACFGISRFATSKVKFPLIFDFSVCETPKWSLCWCACFGISTFLISQLRDSCDEESRLLTPPTPSIQNSEMESDRPFVFSHFETSGLLWWGVSTLDSSIS